ncbi:DUF4139 domain-containing protein [Elusimicrobiota bacterium]
MKKTVGILLILFFALFSRNEAETSSSSRDRTSLSMVIYNSNTALIKDVRKFELDKGASFIRFMDIPDSITRDSLFLQTDKSISVISQSYKASTVNKQNLLNSYIGKKIKLQPYDKDNNAGKPLEAILISNSKGPIYEINGEIHSGYPGYQIFPKLPDELAAVPYYELKFKSDNIIKTELAAYYLTGGITWTADYHLVLNDSGLAFLRSIITVLNNTNKAYRKAKISCLAGSLNRIRKNTYNNTMGRALMAEAADIPSIKQDEAGEYYIYDLPETIVLNPNESKQVILSEDEQIPFVKDLISKPDSYLYTYRGSVDKIIKRPVGVYYSFENSKSEGLGRPFPSGDVRLYTERPSGELIYIGEDSIGHIPEGERIEIKSGDAFDVICEESQKEFRRISGNKTESVWEIEVRNRKKEEITLKIIERINGLWKILDNSHDYEKRDAFHIVFNIKVKAKESEKISFKIQTKKE